MTGLKELGMKGFSMKIGTFAAALALFIASPGAAKEAAWTLVIHGGAGDITRDQITAEKDALLRAGLQRALAAGGDVLERGGTAVEAVEAAVRILEDDPNFNAGRGAVLTENGTAELDASIMDGETRRAGAVTVVTTTRNPVSLARTIMAHGKQVMFAGPGADAQARRFGLEQVDPSYFITEEEKDWLRKHQKASGATAALDGMRKYGTVGAVARDRRGHLAAATSTGGRMGKPSGRVGDSPIIGAGTYADDRACAVSATGMGEYYIRSAAAHSICDRMRYLGEGPKVAADAVQAETAALGGTGGVIVVAPDGTPALSFNTNGMMRGVLRAGKTSEIALFGDE